MVRKKNTRVVERKDLAPPKPIFVSQENVEEYCGGKIKNVIRDKKGRFTKKRTSVTLGELDGIVVYEAVPNPKKTFNMNEAVETAITNMNVADSLERVDREVRKDKCQAKHHLGKYRDTYVEEPTKPPTLLEKLKRMIRYIGYAFKGDI